MKFQFNKTELQRINKDLKVRKQALPTLKNKESALRLEVKKHRAILFQLERDLQTLNTSLDHMIKLYSEFDPTLVSIDQVKISHKKIAGVSIPQFESVSFGLKEFSLFNSPAWTMVGVEKLKQVVQLQLQLKIEAEKVRILEYARKKTTQKVNLYEKVQIPTFETAIIKIKRFLEDAENLDRASQKIVKKRKEMVK